MPTEANLKRSIVAWLKRIPNSKVVDMHRSRCGERGIPDTLFIAQGMPFCFELKVDDNEPTKIQLHRMKQLRSAGVKVFAVWSLAEVKAAVALHLPSTKPTANTAAS